jgi:predicted nucleic acid-binding protein
MRLIDTSVAVDHLRGHERATRLLDDLLSAEVPIVGSEVVRFELLAGTRPRDEAQVEQFLEVVDWVPVTDIVSRQAAAFARVLRGSHAGIDDADYLIAATAEALAIPLLTTNVRHFPMLEGLRPAY